MRYFKSWLIVISSFLIFIIFANGVIDIGCGSIGKTHPPIHNHAIDYVNHPVRYVTLHILTLIILHIVFSYCRFNYFGKLDGKLVKIKFSLFKKLYLENDEHFHISKYKCYITMKDGKKYLLDFNVIEYMRYRIFLFANGDSNSRLKNNGNIEDIKAIVDRVRNG